LIPAHPPIDRFAYEVWLGQRTQYVSGLEIVLVIER